MILIPKIGLDMVVVQGTDYEDLKKGPGHYIDTADPWDGTGRVGIAGHRTTYLHPFFNLDQVQPGDTISLITRYGQFDYAVSANFVAARSDRRQGARADARSDAGAHDLQPEVRLEPAADRHREAGARAALRGQVASGGWRDPTPRPPPPRAPGSSC